MILFTIMLFIYKDMMGIGDPTQKENGKQKKKIPVSCPPIPTSTIWRLTVFRGPKNTQNKTDIP